MRSLELSAYDVSRALIVLFLEDPILLNLKCESKSFFLDILDHFFKEKVVFITFCLNKSLLSNVEVHYYI